MVTPQNFKKRSKICIEPIEDWSIFTEECTPVLTSSVISLIAYLRPKNEMAYSSLSNNLWEKRDRGRRGIAVQRENSFAPSMW